MVTDVFSRKDKVWLQLWGSRGKHPAGGRSLSDKAPKPAQLCELFANDHHRDCPAVLTLEHLTVYVYWIILFHGIARDRKTLKTSLPRSMKPSVSRP